jgi:hypothetical protein
VEKKFQKNGARKQVGVAILISAAILHSKINQKETNEKISY